MPRQDYNQLKAENQVTNVSPEQSLRSWHSWQATFAGNSVTFVAIGTDGKLFRFKLKDFCQGERILIHRVHLSHVTDKDKTWLLQESAFVVSLYGPMDMFPRLAEKKKINSEKRGDEGWGEQCCNIHMEHMRSYRYILEMVISKMGIHGENMLHPTGGLLFRTCSFWCLRGWNWASFFTIYWVPQGV